MRFDRAAPPPSDESQESPKDFPKRVQIVSLQQIRDALKVYGEKFRFGTPRLAELAVHFDKRIRPGDILESLLRMSETDREEVLGKVHGRTRLSFSTYVKLREVINKFRSRDEGYDFKELAKTLKKTEGTVRQFVLYALSFTPDTLEITGKRTGHGSRVRNKTDEDPGKTMRETYAKAIRELARRNERINSTTIAGMLRINGAHNMSKDWVEVFLAQPVNKNFVERALKGEV